MENLLLDIFLESQEILGPHGTITMTLEQAQPTTCSHPLLRVYTKIEHKFLEAPQHSVQRVKLLRDDSKKCIALELNSLLLEAQLDLEVSCNALQNHNTVNTQSTLAEAPKYGIISRVHPRNLYEVTLNSLASGNAVTIQSKLGKSRLNSLADRLVDYTNDIIINIYNRHNELTGRFNVGRIHYVNIEKGFISDCKSTLLNFLLNTGLAE